jgi:hypothetical protein
LIKKLSFEFPIITSFPKIANIISILSNHESFEPWLYTNHIQLNSGHISRLHYLTNSDISFYQPITRKYYPLLDCQCILKNSLLKWHDDICKFVIDSIKMENYVYIAIDKFFIPSYSSKEHTHHDMMIFGYNMLDSTFDIADFFQGKYGHSVTSFSNFEKAFYSKYADENPAFNGVQLLKQTDYRRSYTLDVPYIKELLEDYLHSRNTGLKYKLIEEPQKHTWGMDVYNSLIEFILNAEELYLDTAVRSLHVLTDHKKLMIKRIAYMERNHLVQESQYLSSNFQKILDQITLSRNILLKHLIKPNRDARSNAVEILKSVIDSEKDTVSDLIHMID